MKKRIESIDLLRCIGIVLMIMGHVGFGSLFSKIIHTFHMPLFFFTSGICFIEPKYINSFIKRKSITLLVPYLVFGLINYCFYVLINLVGGGEISIAPLQRLFSYVTSGLAVSGALWFLMALFIAVIIFAIILKIKNLVLRILAIFLIFAFGLFSNIFIPIELPFAISQAFVGVGFLYFGYVIKQIGLFNWVEDKKLEWLKIIILIILILLGIFTGYINGSVNMRMNQYSNVGLFIVSSTSIIFALFILCIEVSKLSFAFFNFAKRPLLRIGKNSIVFVCLNEMMIYLCRAFLKDFISNKLVSALIILLVTIFVLYALQFLFIKTKLRYLIGNWQK